MTTTNQRKITLDTIAWYMFVTWIALVIGSIIAWIWVGEVRTSCSSSWVMDTPFGSGRDDHWHCTEMSTQDVKLWNSAYGFLWKFDISWIIVVIVLAVVSFFRENG